MAGNALRFPSISGSGLGNTAFGFYVDYLSTTKVMIHHGEREANSKVYTQSGSFDVPYSSSDIEVLASNIYELAPGHGLTFFVGEVIYVTGFTTAANNGKKEVLAFSGDQVTVTETLTIEAAGDSITIESIGKSHAMTSLAAGFDLHYVYIDDDASTAPTAVFIDTTTELSKNYAKKGWYNGDDRGVGVVMSPSTGAVLQYFDTVLVSDNTIRYVYGALGWPQMGGNMNPNGSWQTPDIVDGSVVTPVNATALYYRITGADNTTGIRVILDIASAERAAIFTSPGDSQRRAAPGGSNGTYAFLGWLDLGASRDIRIGGADVNDNALGIWCLGIEVQI